MKSKLLTIVMAGLVACSIMACDQEEVGGTQTGRVNHEQTQELNDLFPKLNYDKPDNMTYDAMANVVIACLETGKWEEDSSYVFSSHDFGAFFENSDGVNYYYQVILTKALEGKEAEGQYVSDADITYDYLANTELFSEFLHNMYGVERDYYMALNNADIGVSPFYYDEATEAVYYMEHMESLMSYSYLGYYIDDYEVKYVFSVCSEFEDPVSLDGYIVVSTTDLDCIAWCKSLVSVEFIAQ